MNFLLGLCIFGIVACVVALWIVSRECKHTFGAPKRVSGPGPWYYHEFTMPHAQLRGKVFKVYRRDSKIVQSCSKCGHVRTSLCYDQKPHESDTMHRTPEGWQPEVPPAPLTEEGFKKLRR